MRSTRPVVLAVVATCGLSVLPVVSLPAALTRPGDASIRYVDVTLPWASARADAGAQVLRSAPVDVSGASMVGVTWSEDDGPGLTVEVRTDTGSGWGAWEVLPPVDGGPDPGTREARQAVTTATSPLWVDGAESVQVRVAPDVDAEAPVAAAELPASMDVVLVEPGPESSFGTTTAPLVSADAAGPRPAIVPRSAWGADPSYVSCSPDYSRTLKAATVHHTAGSNSYSTQAQAMRQLQADYAYHTRTLGWCDLGYNFVVDKFGTIYEGRAGGVDRPVVGAHAGGFNASTVGISMLGDYSTVTPSPQTQSSVAALVAWKLSLHDVDPLGRTTLVSSGGGTSRYPAGQSVPLPTVFAHRDVGQTACPGASGYAVMGEVRRLSASIGTDGAFVRALYPDLLGRPADAGGLAGWTDQLSAGRSRAALVRDFADSDEYYDREIDRAYRLVFGRAADPVGRRDWRASIYAGTWDYYDVPVPLLASPEFFAASGGTQTGFIRRLYRTVLGRDVDPVGLEGWTRTFQERGAWFVIGGIYQSWEAHSVRVGRLYTDLLGRPGDPAGVRQWTDDTIVAGDDAARDALLLSQEYAVRARSRAAS